MQAVSRFDRLRRSAVHGNRSLAYPTWDAHLVCERLLRGKGRREGVAERIKCIHIRSNFVP